VGTLARSELFKLHVYVCRYRKNFFQSPDNSGNEDRIVRGAAVDTSSGLPNLPNGILMAVAEGLEDEYQSVQAAAALSEQPVSLI
jgi:hypothetical protein